MSAPALDSSTSQGRPEPRLGRRLVGNYLAQLFNQGIRIVEQLFLFPLFLKAWGVDLYKDWMLLFAISTFLVTFTFGTDSYFGNLFLKDIASGDRDALRQHARKALFCSVAITLCLMVPFYLAIISVDVPALLGLSSIGQDKIYPIMIAMTLPAAAMISEQTLQAVYRAYGDFTRGECAFGFYYATQIVCVATVLLSGGSPWTVALCYLTAQTLFTAFVTLDVRRRYPDLRFGLAIPSRAELRQIIPQSFMFFTLTISLVLVQNGTLLLFAVLKVSALAIVTYNAYRIFTGLTQSVANQFAVGGGIEMARQVARGETAACQRLYRETGRINASLGGLLAGVTLPASAEFIGLWTKGAVGDHPWLLGAFLIGILMSAPGQSAMQLLRYTNRPRPLAMAWLGHSVVGLTLAAVLYPVLGIEGAALAFSLCQIIAIGFFLPFVVQRVHGFPALSQLLTSYGAGLLAFGLSYLVARVIFAFPATGIFALGGKVAIWAVVMALPGLFLLTPATKRRAVFGRLLGGLSGGKLSRVRP